MVAASPVIEHIARNCPPDLEGCRRILDVSFENLSKVRAPLLSKTGDDYNLRWTCRGAVATGLCMRGQTLAPGKATVGDLMKCFPDVGNWIEKVSRHFYSSQGTSTRARVTDLFNKLGYTGKVEHFSMWLCFFANKDLASAAPALVKKRTPELLRLSRRIRKRTGMWPTPMVLVEQAREEGIL